MFQKRASALVVLLLLMIAVTLTNVPSFAATEVETIRDNWDVPHVSADTAYGVYAGFGYLVATDRLFQMETSKHTSLGSEKLDYDIGSGSRLDCEPADVWDINEKIAFLDINTRSLLPSCSKLLKNY